MIESNRAAPRRVFISYRREETDAWAGWLYDRLTEHFEVFRDADTIKPGEDFVEAINVAVRSCDVLLVLIGNRWLTISDAKRKRRINNAQDFVRLEIEVALTHNVRVIPILVEGARMPRADDLPTSLARLASRQALEFSTSRFKYDLSQLLKALDDTLSPSRAELPPKPPTPQAPVTLKRPTLIGVSQAARREEHLDNEVRRLTNPSNSSGTVSLTASQVLEVSVSVDLSQARAISGTGVRFRNALNAQADLQNALAHYYSLRIGQKVTKEETFTITVPAHKNIEVIFDWKRILETGMASLAESSRPAVTIAQVPFKIVSGLDFDVRQIV